MRALIVLCILAGCASDDHETHSGQSATSPEETETESVQYPEDLGGKCELWCTLMQEHCNEYAIHPLEGCLSYCNNRLHPLPDGTPGDDAVNTLDCRLTHAVAASTSANPVTECEAASFGGGGICGDYCENYCTTSLSTCTTSNPDYAGAPSYTTQSECIRACNEEFTGLPINGIPVPIQNFGYGNTVYCRQYHLKVALMTFETDGPGVYTMHCPHASRQSTDDTCSDNAKPNTANYCSFATTFCAGSESGDIFAAGTNVGSCMNTLSPLVVNGVYTEAPFPSFADSSGPSLGCLNYWMYMSSMDSANCAKGHYHPDQWLINGGQSVCHP